MAAPADDSYVAASGIGIYGGKYNWPSWRRALTAQTWVEVGTNTLSEIDPEDNPAYNPNHPAAANYHGSGGQTMIIDAWCGACFDQDGSALWLIQGGGHADYAGNEPYKINLSVDAPAWSMIRPPSTDLSGDGSTGMYGDGRPRSTHTYNKLVYIPGIGPATSALGTTYPSLLGIRNPYFMSPTTGEMTFLGSNNPYVSLSEADAMGACYDPLRHCIWGVGNGDPGLCRYDIATDTWYYTDSKNSSGGYIALEYMPDHDCLFMIGKDYASGFRIVNCATLATHTPAATGALVGMTKPTMSGSAARYCQSGQFVAIWNNATDTTAINIFRVPANPMSGAWEIDQLPVSGGNAITPTARTLWGTFGRFFYSKKLDGFGVVNGVTQKLYFYART